MNLRNGRSYHEEVLLSTDFPIYKLEFLHNLFVSLDGQGKTRAALQILLQLSQGKASASALLLSIQPKIRVTMGTGQGSAKFGLVGLESRTN